MWAWLILGAGALVFWDLGRKSHKRVATSIVYSTNNWAGAAADTIAYAKQNEPVRYTADTNPDTGMPEVIVEYPNGYRARRAAFGWEPLEKNDV